MESCRLCGDSIKLYYAADRPFKASYLKCYNCGLVQMAEKDLLSFSAEESHYLNHQNEIGDPNYEKFLSKLLVPVLKHWKKGMRALDFGCGPAPAMASLYESMTRSKMESYDPIFFPSGQALTQKYDIITASEVVEHFYAPARSWEVLTGLLRPGGMLGVMTSPLKGGPCFENWSYRYDRTHVAFYSEEVFAWLGQSFGLTRLPSSGKVQIFKRS